MKTDLPYKLEPRVDSKTTQAIIKFRQALACLSEKPVTNGWCNEAEMFIKEGIEILSDYPLSLRKSAV